MITREAAGTLLTHAGPEIGVASTKAFTAQIVALALLALHLGRLRGTLTRERCRELLESLARVPHLMENALAMSGRMDEAAKWLARSPNMLYLGRGVNYPIALEGALKMKEISYIHAEGYPAGEMKHGPIALIDESLPVVALCPQGRVYDKMLSNVQEVKARGGRVIAITFQGDTRGPQGPRQGPGPHLRRARGGGGLVAAAHGPAPAAHGLPHGRPRRPRRRPAEEPREVRHRRVVGHVDADGGARAGQQTRERGGAAQQRRSREGRSGGPQRPLRYGA